MSRKDGTLKKEIQKEKIKKKEKEDVKLLPAIKNIKLKSVHHGMNGILQRDAYTS